MTITVQIPSGRQITVDTAAALIGRNAECDIVLPGEGQVHSRHATIRKVAGKWIIESEGDWPIRIRNGVPGRKCWLTAGDVIFLTESGPNLIFMPSKVSQIADQSGAVPEPPNSVATAWLYYIGDRRMGPVGSQQLKDLARTGQIRPDSFVWKEGMSKPQPASKLKGLFEPSTTSPPPIEEPPKKVVPSLPPESSHAVVQETITSVNAARNEPATDTTCQTPAESHAGQQATPANRGTPKQLMKALLIGYVVVGVSIVTVVNLGNRLFFGSWLSASSSFSYTLLFGTAVGILGLYQNMVTDTPAGKDEMPDEWERLFKESWGVGLFIGGIYAYLLSSLVWGVLCGVVITISAFFAATILAKHLGKEEKVALSVGLSVVSLLVFHVVGVQGSALFEHPKYRVFVQIVDKYEHFPSDYASDTERRQFNKELETLIDEFKAVPFDAKGNRETAKAICEMFRKALEHRYKGTLYLEVEEAVSNIYSDLIEN